MRKTGMARLVGVLTALTILLSGCSAFYGDETSPEVSGSELFGTWSAEGPDGKVASFVFNEDGTVIATGIPTGLLDWNVPEPWWDEQVNGEGPWSARVQEDNGVHSIGISATPVGLSLLSVMRDEVQYLVGHIGDPDERNRVTFEKVS